MLHQTVVQAIHICANKYAILKGFKYPTATTSTYVKIQSKRDNMVFARNNFDSFDLILISNGNFHPLFSRISNVAL